LKTISPPISSGYPKPVPVNKLPSSSINFALYALYLDSRVGILDP
jgi:hypothetical protein